MLFFPKAQLLPALPPPPPTPRTGHTTQRHVAIDTERSIRLNSPKLIHQALKCKIKPWSYHHKLANFIITDIDIIEGIKRMKGLHPKSKSNTSVI